MKNQAELYKSKKTIQKQNLKVLQRWKGLTKIHKNGKTVTSIHKERKLNNGKKIWKVHKNKI